MTWKRFTLIECNGNIEDGCTQIVYDGGEDVFILLDLLNSLNDKNEQLKTELINIELDRDYFKAKAGSLEEGYLQLQDREIRLKRENEQLKAQLSEAKADEKQLGISFMGYKMKLIEVLQKKYDKVKGKTLYADVYTEIAEEMGVDLE